MKSKMIKRISTFMLTCMVGLGVSVAAFAATPANLPDAAEQTKSEVVMVQPYSDQVVPSANSVVTGSVSALSNKTFTVHLNSYVGFFKTFRVTSQSPSSGGGIDVVVYKGSKLVSDGNWWMGVNDTGDWKLTLPSSGDYTVKIINNSSDTVYVTMQWL